MASLMHFIEASLIFAILFSTMLPGQSLPQAQAAVPLPQSPLFSITIPPDSMTFSGDVAWDENTTDPTVRSWLDNAPANSILLGVNPSSLSPKDWHGGSATATFALNGITTKTRLVLRVSWPNRDGKGIHSPFVNRIVSIDFDGKRVWDKRTKHRSTFMDYYGAESTPILTTLVTEQAGPHTLRFAAEANTAWDISEITIEGYPYPENYLGIGYSPYRDCQYPGGEEVTATTDMRDDMVRLAHTTNAIRTYSALYANGQVPQLANEQGLAVFPGAWLDYPKTSEAADSTEIDGLVDLACGANVRGVIVGNEYYLRHRTTEHLNYLHERILDVKKRILTKCNKAVPVTTAEIDDLMFQWTNGGTQLAGIKPEYQAIMDDLDFVMIHIYPFWSGMPIEGAAEYVVNHTIKVREWLQTAYPGKNKWVIIGETGWPSAGGANGSAFPTEYNQRKYMLELLPLVEQNNIHLLYFDAFDELWKIEEGGGVGQRWGYGYSDRSAKHDFYGVFLPTELLPTIEWPFSNTVPRVYLPSITGASDDVVKTFNVFSEWPEGPGHFVPSGWMGDLEQIGFYGCDRSTPHSGEMAIRTSYSPGGPYRWAGIYWLYPENNWGDLPEGLDLRPANKITFWARGEKGGERVRFFAGAGSKSGAPYPDSLQPQVTTGFITLTKEWREYTMNLSGKNLSHVVGGFGWTTNLDLNPSGATLYLDDIQYVYDPSP